MPETSDFPCFIDIYKQEVVYSPSQEGYGVDEVLWIESIFQYLNYITDIDAPLEPWERSKEP